MNLQERLMVMLLAAFDRCMDVVTFWQWTQVRGSVVPQVKITKPKLKKANQGW